MAAVAFWLTKEETCGPLVRAMEASQQLCKHPASPSTFYVVSPGDKFYLNRMFNDFFDTVQLFFFLTFNQEEYFTSFLQTGIPGGQVSWFKTAKA